MTFDLLRAALRGLFWVLAYVGILCAAVIVFAPAGPFAPAAWVAILAIVLHDAYRRFVPPPERIKP